MPNSLQSSAIASPASHKLQTLIHYRTLLPRHHSLPKRGKSVTYVSGTICHLCVGSLMCRGADCSPPARSCELQDQRLAHSFEDLLRVAELLQDAFFFFRGIPVRIV